VTGQILSHFRIESILGSGGMGTVYRARDLALGRTVALKILPSTLDPSLRSRWLREAAASARLQHPGIATFYEAGEDGGSVFIAMELVDGETLRSRLARGPLTVEETLDLATRLLEALGHAHVAGILHRDLKPENVMMLPTGASKLLDFGLARQIAPDDAPQSRMDTLLTAPGVILGTPGYMAPEQLCGDPVDERADLFSLAALLYEAVTGRPAFPGSNPTERLAVTLSRDPAPLPHPGLWSVLSRALDRDPARRFPNTRAFRPKSAVSPPVSPPHRCRTPWPSSTPRTSPGIPPTAGSEAGSPKRWPPTTDGWTASRWWPARRS
jgi:serine/threonine protein kinase